jgi:predicted DNA-binding protein
MSSASGSLTEQNKKDVPLYIRMDAELKERLLVQCDRLKISQAAITKMALVRFLEEEEQIEADNAFRKK